MADDTVTLIDNRSGQRLDMPVLEPSYGSYPAIDVSGVSGQLGYLLYDQGYASTASCTSSITYLDGKQSELLYRGYPIDQLAKRRSYLEVAYLLLFGELPTDEQQGEFVAGLAEHAQLRENMRWLLKSFYHDTHPMAMMMCAVSSLAAFDARKQSPEDPEYRLLTAMRMIAKVPILAAACYKHTQGQPLVYPREDFSYCGNLLNMMFSVPAERYHVSPVAERALDALFILHADHEQNASTATVRLAGSTGANPYAAVSAGVACLWGAHGAAHELVMKQLLQIQKTEKNIDRLIARAKDSDDAFRLMGFGHSVYQNYDPRAELVKDIFHQVLTNCNDDPLMELALRLEEVALKDDYFIERRLYPNVDFYSGIIYRALGIPTNMYTVMFAVARTVGWISQWMEMRESEARMAERPRQLYTGEVKRPVPAK